MLAKDGADVEAAIAGGRPEVLATAEPATCSGDDHCAHRNPSRGYAQRSGQLIEQRRGDRVEDVRPVQGEGQHAVGYRLQQLRSDRGGRLDSHRANSTPTPSPAPGAV